MQFFLLDSVSQGYHQDHTDPVHYSYSLNVGNLNNFYARMTLNDKNNHSYTTHTY